MQKTLIPKFDFLKLASPDLDRNFWSADIETVQSPAAYILGVGDNPTFSHKWNQIFFGLRYGDSESLSNLARF